MELQNNIPTHQPLSEVDMAKAGHDLTSWILQDDMFDQDFCYGAKESHSPFVGVESQCDSPFIDIDVKDHLFDVDVTKIDDFFINLKDEEQKHQIPEQEQHVTEEPSSISMIILDDDIHLDNLMKAEMNQQLQLQRLQFIKENEERDLKERERQLQLKHEKNMEEALLYQERLIQQEKQQQIFQQKRQELQQLQEQQQNLMQESQQDIKNSFTLFSEIKESDEIVYLGSIDSPESAYVSANCSPSYDQSSGIQSSPCIIPVTISEACSNFGKQEQFNQVSFSNVNEQEKYQPGRLVIKVKKHTVPVINVTAPSVPTIESTEEVSQDSSTPTLKDVLQSDYAEDFIRDLMTSSSPSPSFEGKSYHDEDSIMSDESMDDEIPNNISSLLSPSSTYSSDYSSSQSCSPSPSQCSGRSIKIGVRGRPYATADRKERKKEQNKRAALRYREKKREEEMGLQKILDKEEARRIKLQEKYRSLQMEIKCMKKLAREMLTAQGKI